MGILSNNDGANRSTSKVGDVAHYAILLSTLFFAGTVAVYMKEDQADNVVGVDVNNLNHTILDATWTKQGFCIAHADEPYFTSHDVCLYVDVVAAVVLTIVYLMLRKQPGMELANPLLKTGIPGVLGHGIGHGALAYAARAGSEIASDKLGWELMLTMFEVEGAGAVLVTAIPYTFFWMTLLKASLPNKSWAAVAATATLAQFVQLWVPTQFGFTFVQTVLMVAFSWNQLARPVAEKDFGYALYAAAVGFPLTMVGWMESTQCSAFVMDMFYGHVVYDTFIPCSMLVWYLSVYLHAKTTNSSTNKKKTQ